MFCFNCGAKIEDDSKSCPICGADLEESNENVTNYVVDEAVPQKKKSRKKIVIIVIAVIILAAVATAATYFIVKYGCKYGIHDNHKWDEATCDLPITCGVCGVTQGEKLGHDWENANCTTPKTCKRCGHAEGNALGHTWQSADCTNPKKCKRCGYTEGNAIGHDWKNANCTTPKTCKKCNATEGEVTGHKWEEATCKTPKTCSMCGQKEGMVSGHKLDSNGKCTVCGYYGLKVGDIVKFGSYEQDEKSSNGKEAIDWEVLAKENGKALLISRYGLESKPYNKEHTKVTWEECSLRKWLNNDFYENAFTSSEKNKIVKSYVTADKTPWRENPNPGNSTYDNVFLLSIIETQRYFGSNSSRECKLTTHAKNNGVWTNSKGCCCWWLRSPGNVGRTAAFMNAGFEVDDGPISDNDIAVRPALWIKM